MSLGVRKVRWIGIRSENCTNEVVFSSSISWSVRSGLLNLMRQQLPIVFRRGKASSMLVMPYLLTKGNKRLLWLVALYSTLISKPSRSFRYSCPLRYWYCGLVDKSLCKSHNCILRFCCSKHTSQQLLGVADKLILNKSTKIKNDEKSVLRGIVVKFRR